jgi:hypothetical protein
VDEFVQIPGARNALVLVEMVRVACSGSLAGCQSDNQPDMTAAQHILLAEPVVGVLDTFGRNFGMGCSGFGLVEVALGEVAESFVVLHSPYLSRKAAVEHESLESGYWGCVVCLCFATQAQCMVESLAEEGNCLSAGHVAFGMLLQPL